MQCLRFQAIQRRGISTAGRALDERNPVIVTPSRRHMCFRNRRGGEYVDPAATLSAGCARDAIPDIPRRLIAFCRTACACLEPDPGASYSCSITLAITLLSSSSLVPVPLQHPARATSGNLCRSPISHELLHAAVRAMVHLCFNLQAHLNECCRRDRKLTRAHASCGGIKIADWV